MSFAVELAGCEDIGDKLRIEPRRLEPDGEGADASRFSPKQWERMRRPLIALASPRNRFRAGDMVFQGTADGFRFSRDYSKQDACGAVG